MLIFIDSEGNYPRFIGDVLVDYPDWNEKLPLPSGWQLVKETAPPRTALENQVIEELAPVGINGELRQQWSVRDMNEEELLQLDPSHTAKMKLIRLGFTQEEIDAIAAGIKI
jgi:hypothetical protein